MLRRHMLVKKEGPITPLGLAPSLWIDASDLDTMYTERTGAAATTKVASDGDPIGTWKDKSGGLYFTSSTDSKRPTFKTQITGGRPAALFDFVDDSMSVTSALVSSVANYTIFTVRQFQTPSSSSCLMAAGLTIPGYYALGTPDNIRTYTGASAAYGYFTANTNWNIIATIYDGSQSTNGTRLRQWKEGIEQTLTFSGTISSTTNPHTSIVLGAQNVSATYFKGYIAEMLIFTYSLTIGQMLSVSKYLGAKWGIPVA